jgi:hypothetical protein
MASQVIFHTQNNINCNKIINQLIKGEKYVKHYNKYLIPYHCTQINHPNRVIYGKFVYPMWNTLERTILSRGAIFNYSYIKGKDYVIECNPSTFRDYHIFGETFVYANGVKACEHTLLPNSMLLFSIDKDVALPLIQNQLL